MAIAAQALCEGELRVMVGVRELEGLEMELQASERILRGLREQVTHWELGQLRVRERKESPLLSPGVLKAVLGKRNELELWSMGEVDTVSLSEAMEVGADKIDAVNAEIVNESNTNTTNTTGSSSSTTVKEKKLTVKVGEDKVYDKKVDLNSTNIQTKISGKGTVTVKVYVDDILKSQKDINLNTTSSYTFE